MIEPGPFDIVAFLGGHMRSHALPHCGGTGFGLIGLCDHLLCIILNVSLHPP